MRTVLATLLSVPALLAGTALRAEQHPVYPDAALRAVQFVDEHEGWSAGDDGVIWHTIDGGATWERQPSGTRASLRALHFLTPYTGWAVGREELPGGASRGVVLATTDGGLKWTQLAANSLPGLNCVRFFNERTGVAAGDGGDAFPTGVFATIDGGQTWRPIPGQRCPTWLAADFTDPDNGLLAGAWSRMAPIRNGLFGVADNDDLVGSRSVRGLKVDGNRAFAVGQGGLVMRSSNGGLRWGFVEVAPREVLASIDFHAVAVSGDHVWAAGRPGSAVLHSADGGGTWEVQRTGQALPLHALQFVSATDGWAVGELGTVVRTHDGGKTWKVEKVGQHTGQRAAALFVHASGRTTPLDTVAVLGRGEGYLTAALSVGCADAASAAPARAADPERLAAAVRASGGLTAEARWEFPVPGFADGSGVKELLAGWDRIHADKAAEQLLRQLVLALRVWRPEVVVTDTAPGDAAESLVVEALKEAFKQAGDRSAFPEQLEQLGLAPWGAKKLYALTARPDPTAVRVDVAQPVAAVGDSPREFVYPAERLLQDDPERPQVRGYRLLATRIKDAAGHAELMAGVDLAPGGTARRKLPSPGPDEQQALAALRKAFETRRNFEAVARPGASPLSSPDQALALVGDSLKELPADMGARAMFALGMQYARAGQWHLAREVFLLQADQYPAHPMTADAYRWLVRYHSSSEARRREELGQFILSHRGTVQLAPSGEEQSHLPPQSELVVEQKLLLLRNLPAVRKWYQGSLSLEPRLASYGRLYARDVPIQLCLQSARRQLGELEAAKKWCNRYLSESAVPTGAQPQEPGSDPWRDCVITESWLTNRASTAQPPKPLGYAAQAAARPHLDGKLDDECWQSARPLNLKTCAGGLNDQYGSRALFTYDHEFLYVGIECTHPEREPAVAPAKRYRDADLGGHDRVNLLIDLDRDYQTYYRFQIDDRGCLAEDCWGDRSWNPRWFVAVHAEPTCWTAEVAIPLVELTGDGVGLGRVWAANVTRVVPGKGLQTWSGPADAEPRPEGMGILQFVGDGKR